MDGAHFDRLSRLVARSSTRRSALAIAASLGLGISQTEAGKERNNKCKGGCGPCKVCKKQGKQKKCVPAPSSATCASLGNVCGPAVADGCGGTLACGPCSTAGLTPVCNAGICATCAATCATTCTSCFGLPDGLTICGNQSSSQCTRPCTIDADCPIDFPLCVATFTNRNTNAAKSLAQICEKSEPGICSKIDPC